MSLPSTIFALVFDMDGVLLDSSPIHAAAYRQVLEPFGIVDFAYPPFAGMRTREALALIFAQRGMSVPPVELDRLAESKTALALASIRESGQLFDGCAEVLHELKERSYRLALASSASAGTVDAFFSLSGCGDLFDVVLRGTDVARAKPAPDIYSLACNRLCVDPSNSLVIEDAVSGVVAGKSAGAWVWGLATTTEPAALLQAGADRVITSLWDLR